MNKQFSLTLPVADLPKSIAFFKALGFSEDPQFSGDTAAGIILCDAVFIMLLTHPKFAEFSPKPICDTSKAVEALFGIRCESRAQVDDLVAKAGKAGGIIHEQSVDYGFLYHASFADLDGHLWALNYMSDAPPQG